MKKRKTMAKRLLSSVTSALLAVSSMLPAGFTPGEMLSAGAATDVSNLSNDKTVTDVQLLVGSTPQKPDGTLYQFPDDATIASVTNAIDNDYFLGIASQFSVFMPDYYIPHDSDSEGRMAIGNYFKSETGGEYQIGKGDFTQGNNKGNPNANLENLIKNQDYARIIWNAGTDTVTPEKGVALEGVGWEAYSEEHPGRNIAFDKNKTVDSKTTSKYLQDQYGSYQSSLYGTNGALIDYQAQMALLKQRSTRAAKQKNQFDVTGYTTAFDNTSVNVATVKYNGDGSVPTDVVYLNLSELSEEQYKAFKTATFIRFENIPKLASYPDGRLTYDNLGNEVRWDYAYIVINDDSEKAAVGYQIEKWTTSIPQFTSIRGNGEDTAIFISQGGSNSDWPWVRVDADGNFTYPLNKVYGDNNEPGVTSILYNFPNAKEVAVMSSVQGTILAPNAHITDINMLAGSNKKYTYNDIEYTNGGVNPHLSGALIAQSFEGNTEMGYRPFNGPVSIAGKGSDGSITVTKKIEQSRAPLNGTTLSLYDGENLIDSAVTGTVDGIEGVAKLNFSISAPEEVEPVTKTYTIKETRATNGFEMVETTYQAEVTAKFKEEDKVIVPYGDPVVVIRDQSGAEVDTASGAVFSDKAQVWILKADDEGNPLPGAGLQIASASAPERAVMTFASADTPKILEIGSEEGQIEPGTVYILTETAVPDGYKQAAPIYFQVKDDYKVYYAASEEALADAAWSDNQITMTDIADGWTLLKLGSDGGPLENVTFDVYTENGTLFETGLKTNQNGRLKPEKEYAPNQTYYLVETGGAEGYETNQTPQYFYLDENGVHSGKAGSSAKLTPISEEHTFQNCVISFGEQYANAKGTSLKYKVDHPDQGEWGLTVQYKESSDEQWDSVEYGKVDSVEYTDSKLHLDPQGKIKLTYWWGVNALKDFQLEIKTPPTVPDTNVITAEGRTLTFVNNKISQITFRKVDDSRNRSGRGGEDSIPAPKPVAGAKMVLTAPEGTDLSGVTSSLDAATDNTRPVIDNTARTITWVTGENPVTFTNLPDGTYTLTETEVPSGYRGIQATPLKIEGGKVVSSTTDTGVDPSGDIVTVTDSIYSVSIRKTQPNGMLGNNPADTPVPGAKLVLTGTNASGAINFTQAGVEAHDNQFFNEKGVGLNATMVNYLVGDTFIPNISGTDTEYAWYSTGSAVIFTRLPVGEYVIREEETPLGFITAPDKRFEVVKNDEGVLTIEVEQPIAGDKGTAINSTDNVTWDQVTVSNTIQPVTFSKSDLGGEPVKGALFELTPGTGVDLSNIGFPAEIQYTSAKDETTQADGGASYVKWIKLELGDRFITEIRGNTFNGVSVGTGETLTSLNETPKQVDYVKTFTKANGLTGNVMIDGLYDGIYIVTLNDGTEIAIRVDYDKETITDVRATKKPTAASEAPTTASELTEPVICGGKLYFTGGNATFNSLNEGTYTLKETAAPKGYTVESTFTFDVDGSGKLVNDSIKAVTSGDTFTEKTAIDTAENKLTIGDSRTVVHVSKQELVPTEDGKNPTGKEIAANADGTENAATFKLTAKTTDDSLVGITIYNENDTNDKGKTLTEKDLNEDGSYTFKGNATKIEGLTEGNTYSLQETNAPKGYDKTVESAFDFTIKNGVAQLVEAATNGEYFIDEKGRIVVLDAPLATLTVSKQDMGGEELEGAAIEFTKVNVTEAEGVLTAGTTDEAFAKQSWTSGSDGKNTETEKLNPHIIKDLADGWYLLHETAAPDGYAVVTDVYVRIADGKVIGTYTKNDDGTLKSLQTIADGTVVLTDNTITATISKKDATNGGAELEGAVITVTSKSGADLSKVTGKQGTADVTVNYDSAKHSVTFTSGKNETVLSYLPAGEYTLTEDTAPLGYTTDTAIDFTVGTDGSITVNTAGKTDLVLTDEVITAAIGKVELTDGRSKELKGAKLTLTNTDGTSLADVTVTGGGTDVEKNANSITFISGETDTVLTMLPAGNYELTEIATPDDAKFNKAENITFTIGKDGKVTNAQNAYASANNRVVMLDTHKDVISINKKAIDGSTEVDLSADNKATFTLTGENLTKSDVYVNGRKMTVTDGAITFEENHAEITGLTDGTYTLEEITAPDGFTVASSFTFTVTGNHLTAGEKNSTGDMYVDENGSLVVTDSISTIEVSKEAFGSETIASGNTAAFTLTALTNTLTLEGVSVNGGNALGADTKFVDFNGNSAKIKGLKDGIYTLREVTAPDGYTAVSSVFTFEVKNGVIDTATVKATTDGDMAFMDASADKLIVKDTRSTVSVSKQALSGVLADDAHFVLKSDKDLTGVVVLKKGSESVTITGTDGNPVYEYAFEGNDVTFEGLKNGDYTLEETVAPTGFECVESAFSFAIENGELKPGEKVTTGESYMDAENGTIVVMDAPEKQESVTTSDTTSTTSDTSTTTVTSASTSATTGTSASTSRTTSDTSTSKTTSTTSTSSSTSLTYTTSISLTTSFTYTTSTTLTSETTTTTTTSTTRPTTSTTTTTTSTTKPTTSTSTTTTFTTRPTTSTTTTTTSTTRPTTSTTTTTTSTTRPTTSTSATTTTTTTSDTTTTTTATTTSGTTTSQETTTSTTTTTTTTLPATTSSTTTSTTTTSTTTTTEVTQIPATETTSTDTTQDVATTSEDEGSLIGGGTGTNTTDSTDDAQSTSETTTETSTESTTETSTESTTETSTESTTETSTESTTETSTESTTETSTESTTSTTGTTGTTGSTTTTTTTTTARPATTASGTSASPKTADAAAAVPIVLMLTSLATAGAALTIRRRRDDPNDKT